MMVVTLVSGVHLRTTSVVIVDVHKTLRMYRVLLAIHEFKP